MRYMLPDGAYKALKWLGLIVCPAVATFVGVVGVVWGWPDVDAWVTTINAVGVLVGALLGISAATARPTDDGAE
ncbi:MAG: phage holin [Coriobacteriaceae bacterium]|nr:phage holin [Coriobacteriaceae bacterium]